MVRAAVKLQDRAEVLSAYLHRIRPAGSQVAATAVGSAVSLNPATSNATLTSVEEVNLDPTASTPRAPLWLGSSTAQANLGGSYDGSLGTTTLTATVTKGGVRGSSNAQVEVTDDASPYKEKININKSDPLSTVYTLSNGLEFTFGSGNFVKNDTFGLQVQTGTAVKPDPDGTFDASAGTDVNTEAALPVVAGSFTVNGELITVAANDTINSVLAQINASNAGVTASYAGASEVITLQQNSGGSQPSIVLDNDTSGFLAAMKLDAAIVVPGTDSELDKPIAEVPILAGISSGSLLINETSIAIDTSIDSINAVIDAINASSAGVTAELVNNSYLSVRQIGNGNLTLDSNGTGFFETLQITSGIFNGSAGAGRPSSYSLYEISRQTEKIVDGLNDLFATVTPATALPEVADIRQQVTNLVRSELTQPLANLGLSTGFQPDDTQSRPSAFSDLNASELRRGFRWRFDELTTLFAGSRLSSRRGALHNLIELLDKTVLAPNVPGSLIDETA